MPSSGARFLGNRYMACEVAAFVIFLGHVTGSPSIKVDEGHSTRVFVTVLCKEKVILVVFPEAAKPHEPRLVRVVSILLSHCNALLGDFDDLVQSGFRGAWCCALFLANKEVAKCDPTVVARKCHRRSFS